MQTITKESEKICTYTVLDRENQDVNLIEREEIAEFIQDNSFGHRDSLDNINNAINYVFKGEGGFILLQYNNYQILTGVAVMNETGMRGYLSDNILVYLAVSKKVIDRRISEEIVIETINRSEGDISLHLEKRNPARFIFEKLGFTNPFLEMRLSRTIEP